MKIAFTSKGEKWDSPIDERFGRTAYFLLYDEEKDELVPFDNRAIDKETHGAGPKSAQKLFELGAEVLVTGNGPGDKAASVLGKTRVKVFVGAGQMTVKEAYHAYKNSLLEELE